jgi:RNA polymerase sigma-70 factor (ECF subfamily)
MATSAPPSVSSELGLAASSGPDSASPDERRLVEALRRGDESAFAALVESYSGSMLRIALMFVSSRAVAEEVVQEAWLGVLQGLERFEGRSSLRTWIFRILTNRAKTRAAREGRSVPFSSLARDDAEAAPSVDPDRFLPADHEQWPGHWASPPQSWAGIPESRLIAAETMDVIRGAIEGLAAAQRAVITMRDVFGCTAAEVCDTLGVNEVNQRVLLHRARSRVRAVLEEYLAEPARG